MLLERVQRDPGVHLCVAVRRQCVIGAACVISNRHWCPGAQENTASTINIFDEILCIYCVYDEMLWRIPTESEAK